MTTVTIIDFDDLRGALKAAGMTQTALSYATGIDQAQISRYVNGLVPGPRNAVKIAEALGLLVDGEREPIKVQVSADAKGDDDA